METKRRLDGKLSVVLAIFLLFIITSALFVPSSGNGQVAPDDAQFTSQFRLQDCTFETEGANPYFILTPGYQLVLEGEERDDEGVLESVRVVISVLRETQDISLPGLGTIPTRVVEEREWTDDELVEISRNFFARCKETNDVFYFGEDVDNFDGGQLISHEGAWRAGVNGATPGMIMPGTFLLGSKYFQEQAPGIAMDRAEHVAMGLGGTIEAGTFAQCVGIVETSPLEPGDASGKFYCPGVGLVADADADGIIFLAQFGLDILDTSQ
jgi:hypothetical protein